MSYPLLKKKEFKKGRYKIIPIRNKDKFKIMQWRNEQIDILRQKDVLTKEMQTRYFEEVVSKELKMQRPNQILVSFLFNKELIGYGGLVHIDWISSRAEVSFLLDTKRNENIELLKKDYSIFLSLIKFLAFRQLNLHKLTTEAFDIRPHITQTLEENGFMLEGRLKKQNLINGRFVDSLLHGCFAKTI